MIPLEPLTELIIFEQSTYQQLFSTTAPAVIPEKGERIQIAQKGVLGWTTYQVTKREIRFDASTDKQVERIFLFVKKLM